MASSPDPSRAVLDRPVWHALTGRQADLALGDRAAVRLAPEYGPFAAAGVPGGDLAGLVPLAGRGELWLVEKQAVVPPAGLRVVRQALCVQMVAERTVAGGRDAGIAVLGDADAAEMVALAMLTQPGPFAARTHRLGRFVGIREKGRLVAMAGERMKPGTFTELSGVCSHPDHRGRGHAGALMRVVAAGMMARGETPFLHCYADNAGAIALYRTLGFEIHQQVTATVLAPG